MLSYVVLCLGEQDPDGLCRQSRVPNIFVELNSTSVQQVLSFLQSVRPGLISDLVVSRGQYVSLSQGMSRVS
jgi:hypothetical protein